ncbi:serine hydrolase domain-containing protein [Hufsiella ginkgonis]|uniref:Serine hydrolase n=1 Tax=Hufsiella ginkgonis TaxID=2695274 RepID=A0A7K1XXZ4_9SPHI|nr:serine hydrolase domain-containing protein [Hufsiella ginkgonis]MXV15813.1 serine hydrolase [Hufsiella ginkgonis]
MNQENFKKATALMVLLSACLPTRMLAQETSQRLDSQFVNLVRHNEFNGNVLIAQQGKTIYSKSFGFADVAGERLNDAATTFNLASISKTFTSVAVLQLMEKRKLKLDDRFVRYFPEFPFADITISQLLSHTSGLIDYQIFEGSYQRDFKQIYTLKDLIPAIKADKRALGAKPGERWSYSNTGYGLLALLVEKLSGEAFQDYLSRHIFSPAGMNNSYVTSPLIPIKDSHRATRYEYVPYAPSVFRPVDSVKSDYIDAVVLGAILGPTAVVSNCQDLLNYDQALYAGKLLKAKTLKLAFTPAVLNSGEKVQMGWGGSYYGLGWMILQTRFGKVVWHSGGAAGIVTAFIRNLDKGQTLIVLDNVTHRGLHADAMDAFYLLNGASVAKKKRSAAAAYIAVLHRDGANAAAAQLLTMRSDTAAYFLDEREMNRLGYALAGDGFSAEALEVMKVNTLLFPASFNTYDSYGDLLKRAGKKQEAILMFERSLALNPNYEGAKKALAELNSGNH